MELDIGSRIRKFRNYRGYTQAKFAELCGLSTMSIRRYESNERQPSIELLRKMAEVLDRPFGDFFLDDSALKNNWLWIGNLEDKLVQEGFSLGYYNDSKLFWVNYPDGTVNVPDSEINDLYEKTYILIKILYEELKKKYINDFKKFPADNNEEQ